MNILIERAWPKEKYTIGKLYIDGVRICETLEDTDRGLTKNTPLADIKKTKVYGQTAIPKGTYDVKMTFSQKFCSYTWAKPTKGHLPLVSSVPGFEGIRIHPGNSAKDTYGCILVGKNTKVGQVTSSQVTYRNIVDNYILPAVERGESISLTIR